MPSISVIIPVFNGEKTITKTIESVLNQSFSDLELIVINDGSQDGTLDVISRIKDPRFKVFSYSNAGLSASRNRGINHATSEYISFIDADDLWTKDKLEAQFNALQTNPQAALAYSWTDWIDEAGNFLRSGGHITANGNVYKELLLRDFIESGSNPLIHKQALAEVGTFDEEMIAVEDWDMWLRLAAKYEFVSVPLPQILYRISSNSMSTDVWKMEAASLQIINKNFANAPASIQHLKRECLASRYKYLTFKAIDSNPERRRVLTAIRFLWEAISRDFSMLLRVRIILIILLKIILMAILSSDSEKVLNSFKRIAKKSI